MFDILKMFRSAKLITGSLLGLCKKHPAFEMVCPYCDGSLEPRQGSDCADGIITTSYMTYCKRCKVFTIQNVTKAKAKL